MKPTGRSNVINFPVPFRMPLGEDVEEMLRVAVPDGDNPEVVISVATMLWGCLQVATVALTNEKAGLFFDPETERTVAVWEGGEIVDVFPRAMRVHRRARPLEVAEGFYGCMRVIDDDLGWVEPELQLLVDSAVRRGERFGNLTGREVEEGFDYEDESMMICRDIMHLRNAWAWMVLAAVEGDPQSAALECVDAGHTIAAHFYGPNGELFLAVGIASLP